jgi:holo-[acyl-carrier protein] synthase
MQRLSVGMDLVDIREVEASLDRFGHSYLERVYTPEEVAYAASAPGEAARRLGARFAAKEATIKALRAGDEAIDPRAIHVKKCPDGGCEIDLSGSALRAARRAGVVALGVSISHQGDLAAAVVVAERRRPRSSLWWRPRSVGARAR